MPGAPQINTGLMVATFNSISSKSLCVTEIGKFIFFLSKMGAKKAPYEKEVQIILSYTTKNGQNMPTDTLMEG